MPLERFCVNCNSTHIGEREVAQTAPNIAGVSLPANMTTPIRVICLRKSDSANDLVEALADLGVPAVRIRTKAGIEAAVAKPRGTLIGWGEALPNVGTRPALNRNPLKDKLVELQKLKEGGVLVPEFAIANTHPTGNMGGVPGAGWLTRTRNHQSASDLLYPSATADFYTKKLNITEEWRVHVFGGKSIRVGKKVPGDEAAAHAWIRSLASGWKLDYGASLQGHAKAALIRGVSKAAVAALGLHFGAVDVGITADGLVVVFEVNTAPGLTTDNTALAYAKAIATACGLAGATTEA